MKSSHSADCSTTATEQRTFADLVLDWFAHHGRKDLPWQLKPTAYGIWVSGIMLQQTQVATVIDYYRRFMDRFPRLDALAEAEIDEVLHLWSGLGYYARARNLHAAAKVMLEQHGGRPPRSLDALMALPGIGRSTAGAILSLAYGDRYAILDGNVKRVLARSFTIAGWPGKSQVQRRLWSLAEELLPASEVGSYNQAMMDLGATVCKRNQPECGQCPLVRICQACRSGSVSDYPAGRPEKSKPVRSVHMAIVNSSDGWLMLEQRPASGIWGGLWSFPEYPDLASVEAWSLEALGVGREAFNIWPDRKHSFTHFHLQITPVEIRLNNVTDCVMDGNGLLWYNSAQSAPLGLAAPVARIIDELMPTENGA